ncbi:MAG: hypothetical protein GX602_01260 [Dehalococcoidales bacterium]|nr:hypothetical protein [Dehalococcoidales bacterium]
MEITGRFHRQPRKAKKWMLALLSLAIISFGFSGINSVLAVSPFIQHTGEVTIGDIQGVADSWVIWDEDEDVYKMWFTHPKTDVSPSQVSSLITGIDLQAVLDALEAQDVEALLDHISNLNAEELYNMLADSATVIGYATSSDGITWNVIDPEVLTAEDEHDLQNVANPCVIKDGNDYHMWYTRSTTDYTLAVLEEKLPDLASENDEEVVTAILDLIAGNRTVIDYATSNDGESWSEPTPAVLSGDTVNNVAAPCVLKVGDGDYRMWFSNVSTGITQEDIEYLVENKDTVTTEYLWDLQEDVTGSIGYATSIDGESWDNIDRNVFSGGTGALNAVAAPCVVYNGTDYEMWYTYGVTALTREDIDAIIDELSEIDLDPLIALMEDEDYDGLLEDLRTIIDDEIPETKTRLEGTATRIGYASSADGTSGWETDNTYGLTGTSNTPWDSVACPCVIERDGVYQMWFTKGIEELTSQNLVDLWQGNISTIGYASSSAMVAETETRIAVDGDGVVVIEAVINRIKDGVTGETVTDFGGITGYRISIEVEPLGGVELVDVRGVAPFGVPDLSDKEEFEFWCYEAETPLQPDNSVVAKIVLRLTGDAVTPYDVNIKFDSIIAGEPAGLIIPEEEENSHNFLRGDANNDGIVDIFDAMYIAQYTVDLREIEELNILNAASVMQDGVIGDKIDIFDAMYIAQYTVDLRDTYFE